MSRSSVAQPQLVVSVLQRRDRARSATSRARAAIASRVAPAAGRRPSGMGGGEVERRRTERGVTHGARSLAPRSRSGRRARAPYDRARRSHPMDARRPATARRRRRQLERPPVGSLRAAAARAGRDAGARRVPTGSVARAVAFAVPGGADRGRRLRRLRRAARVQRGPRRSSAIFAGRMIGLSAKLGGGHACSRRTSASSSPSSSRSRGSS